MDNVLVLCPCEFIVRKVINNSADNAIYSSVLYIAVKIFTQSVKHSNKLNWIFITESFKHWQMFYLPNNLCFCEKKSCAFLEIKGQKILFLLRCMSIVNIYLQLPNIFSLSWYSHQHYHDYQEVQIIGKTTDKIFKTPYFECISCQISICCIYIY